MRQQRQAASSSFCRFLGVVSLRQKDLPPLSCGYAYVDQPGPGPQTARSEKQVATATAQAAKEMTNHPQSGLGIDHAKILYSELSFTNQATTPHYRVFLSDASLELENISNQRLEGTAYVKIAGKFMGTGLAQANGTFRPERPSPDFTVQIRVIKTPLRSLNALLVRMEILMSRTGRWLSLASCR